MNIYEKLNTARTAFHALKLTKTGENKFAGYKYFELGDFLIPALGVFREAGLCAVVTFSKEVATMRIIDIESTKEIILTSPMGSAALKGCHEVQNIGAVETYQRRYLWVAALEIVEHDALDATTGRDKPQAKVAESFRSSPTMGAMDELPTEEQTYLREFSVELVALCRDEPEAAVSRLAAENLDNEQKIGLWSILDSKTRAAIKKAQAAMKETA